MRQEVITYTMTPEKVLEKVNSSAPVFELKQVENKLKIISRGVRSLQEALLIFKKLQ